MTLGRLTALLISKFRGWERNSQIGFFVALALLFPSFIAATAGPEPVKLPAIIAVLGLTFAMQGIFLWENRGMVTEYVKAQRAFMRGEFTQARDLLRDKIATGKYDVQDLTLLGNTYRQLGDLEKSAAVLSEALNIAPEHYFPLYGFGRTLLAQGQYAQAVAMIQRALTAGAPTVIRYDLGEALYRAGEADPAHEQLQAVRPSLADEPHRALMADWMLANLTGQAPPTPSPAALAYWQHQQHLFSSTPYGRALADDLSQLSKEQQP